MMRPLPRRDYSSDPPDSEVRALIVLTIGIAVTGLIRGAHPGSWFWYIATQSLLAINAILLGHIPVHLDDRERRVQYWIGSGVFWALFFITLCLLPTVVT